MFQYVDANLHKIQFFGNTGYIFGSNNSLLKFIDTDGINDNSLPHTTELYQNYPNPFNPTTEITFSLQDDEFVVLSIYNIRGQLVNNLVSEKTPRGAHSITWNGKNNSGEEVNSGMYFCVLKSKGCESIKKMMLIR